MSGATHTGYEVAEIVGIPYRSLMNWVELSLLNPEGARRGKRWPTTWHDKDLREAAILAACWRAGFSRQKLCRVASYLKSVSHNVGEFIAVKTGKRELAELISFCDVGDVVSLLREGHIVLPLPRVFKGT